MRNFAIVFLMLLCHLRAQTLSVNNTTLKFTATVGATTLPAAQTLNVQSLPTGLGFTVAVNGPGPYYGAWLLVSLAGGKAPQTVSVQVNPTGLAAGAYTGTITLTGASGSPTPTALVNVTLTIGTPPPTITVSPSVLSFSYTTSQPIAGNSALTSTFILSNTGAATAAALSLQAAPWLKVNPTGNITLAGLLNSINVTVDPTGLVPRVYTTNVTIKSAAAANPTLTLPVTLTVVAAPPAILSTWPTGVIEQSAQSTVTLYGDNFFANSTVAASGFTNEATITVNDGTNSATESFFIPVFAGANSVLRANFGSPLPGGVASSVYTTVNLAASGGTGPYTWALIGGALPPGLSLSTGRILGTPTSAGSYYFTLRVSDSTSPSQTLAYIPAKLVVLPSGVLSFPRVAGPNALLPAGVTTVSYTGGISAAGAGGSGVYTWSAANLPAGLTINAGTGAISGTPVSVGTTGPLAAKAVGDSALLATLPATMLATPGILRVAVTTPSPGGGVSNDAQFQIFGPQPQLTAVVDSASFVQGNVSPGEIVTIFGLGLGPSALTIFNPALPAPQIPNSLPATGTATSVTVNGAPAPILYTSANQVSVVVPYALSGATADFILSYGGLASQAVTLGVAPTTPGVYTIDASGKGQGAILNYNATTQDYTLNSATTPALRGSTVVLYISGMGTTNTASANTLIPASPATIPTALRSVTIGGQAATIVGAAAPIGSVPGLLQLNVTVPGAATPGIAVPVVVTLGGVDSQAGVTMSIK